jgi:hypothetical protein
MAIVRLVFLYAHVVAFAVALGCVLREDAKLLSRKPIDALSLQATSRVVAGALAVLWLSGVALIVLDTGGSLSELLANAKLLAKILVVVVLTLNGVALHFVAFPALLNPPRSVRVTASVSAALGAVSAVSWAFATLLGISRGIPKPLTFELAMLAFAAAVAFGVLVAVVVVRPIIETKLRDRSGAYVMPQIDTVELR